MRAVFVAGRHRGSEEAEEASPQVDELIDAKQFATTMGVGIGGVIGIDSIISKCIGWKVN